MISWGGVEGGFPVGQTKRGLGEQEGFQGQMQLLKVAVRAGHSPRWPLKHRPGVMDRDFCRPRNTLGVGEAATGNKSFSVPRAPRRPEAAHTLQHVNIKLMFGHFRAV